MARTNPTARPVPRDSPTPGLASATASTPFSSSSSSTSSESSSVSSITFNSSVPQNTCSLRIRAGAGSPGGGGPSPPYPGPNPPNPGPNPPPGIRKSDRHLDYAEMGALRALLLLDQERNGAIGIFYNPPTP